MKSTTMPTAEGLDIFRVEDYREILRQEYLSRIESNPKYSLRAFARDLKLSPSRLSDVLNRKGGFSRKNAHLVAQRLNLSDSEAEMFLALVEGENPKSVALRRSARLRAMRCRTENAQRRISIDHFKVIADWYHLALLELMTLKTFEQSPKWMARTLGLSVAEVEAALQRLVRLEMITFRKGRYELLVSQSSTKSGAVPSKAIIKAHTQLMHKAVEALQRVSLEEREFGSLILAIDSSKMKQAKKLIRDFRKSFNHAMDIPTETKDKVYCLSMQFFQLGAGELANG